MVILRDTNNLKQHIEHVTQIHLGTEDEGFGAQKGDNTWLKLTRRFCLPSFIFPVAGGRSGACGMHKRKFK